MIVPDASITALLFAETHGGTKSPNGHYADERAARAAGVLRADPEWVVPEHWRVEVVSVVRGLLLGGKLSEDRAARAIAWLGAVRVLVVPTRPLLGRMWELRSNLTAYDAGYVAAAEAHGITLLTADRRISRAGVARCPVQTVA